MKPLSDRLKAIREKYDHEAPGNDPWVMRQSWYKSKAVRSLELIEHSLKMAEKRK